MSAHIERAQILLQQSRAADAEREAMLALAQAPDHPLAHAYLALSRSEQGKLGPAEEAARQAVALAPDVAFFHYVLGVVLHRQDKDAEAQRAVEEAIRLVPEEESHFALLSSIHLARRDWAAALEAAERGLALNPEDVQNANLRSMALVRLGRKAEAMETVDYALGREPDNAVSHANQGWNCLHRNDPRRAQDHFREALRLDPDLEYARHGMLEALKARNPVYRGMLAYFLWMARQSGKMQAAFLIVTFFVIRFVRNLAETKPTWGVFLWPLVVLFYAFVYLSWTAVPMFNLLLRFDKFGKFVLSRDERRATTWFGACLALALGGLGLWAWGDELGALVAIVGAGLSMAVSMTFGRTGKSRLWFGVATAGLAAIGLCGLGLLAFNVGVGMTAFSVFCIGFFVMQIAANFVGR
jgi:tetratricopeptide (TPR) repeat protein